MAKKLLDIMRDKIRFKHYSIKTEQSYAGWAKRYILFHNKRHPKPYTPVSESPLFITFEINDFETFKYEAIST